MVFLAFGSSQMYLDSPEALGVLNTLFETVAPSSLRPVDMLLKSMFTIPATMVRHLWCAQTSVYTYLLFTLGSFL